MIVKNQWYAVLDSREVRRNKPAAFRRLGHNLVFYRDSEGAPHCISDTCAHRGASIGLGECAGHSVRCPFHGIEYNSSGKAVFIPSLGKNFTPQDYFHVQAWPTHESDGFIWVYSGPDAPEGKPSFFPELKDFVYGQIIDPWPVHYTRAAENQLDVSHLPFVHRKTIGRGGRIIVDGPAVGWMEPELMGVNVFNRLDNGTPAKKPSEMVFDPGRYYRLEFHMPNTWHNRISPAVRVAAAFVPVDETNTFLYLRFYHRMKIPVLKHLISWLGIKMSLVIAREDRTVVITQPPEETGLTGKEFLVPADAPILAFRKKRMELGIIE